MTPTEINGHVGLPVWQCVTCKTPFGLIWWNGMSVAVCQKPECSKAFSERIAGEVAQQESYDACVRDMYGDA